MRTTIFFLIAALYITRTVAPNPTDRSLLLRAASNGKADLVKTLIASGVDKDKGDKLGFTPLHAAAKEGQLESIRALLSAGANSNKRDKWGKSPLHLAAKEGHSTVARVLVAVGGADKDSPTKVHGWTPLIIAAFHGHVGVVRALVVAGADKTRSTLKERQGIASGSTALDVGKQKGFADIVAVL